MLLLELFSIISTQKVHYKLQQSNYKISTMVAFRQGGLLSMWSFVRTPFLPYLYTLYLGYVMLPLTTGAAATTTTTTE